MADNAPQDVNDAVDTSNAANIETAPAPVSAVQGDDRPVQNVVAEFNRKFSRLQDQLNTMSQLVTQQHQSQAQPVKGQPTDEELWSLAQQGDRSAFELYQERIADRQGRKLMAEQSQVNMVNQQLQTLAQRYPVFNDSQHPLTQTVQTAYQIMVQNGYPASRATLLDAMKTAIADRPDLVSEVYRAGGSAQDATRVSATRRAQAGQTGATTRDIPATGASQTVKISADQAALARRMNIKDPAKAVERFKARQASGQSNLGMVANAITEEI